MQKILVIGVLLLLVLSGCSVKVKDEPPAPTPPAPEPSGPDTNQSNDTNTGTPDMNAAAAPPTPSVIENPVQARINLCKANNAQGALADECVQAVALAEKNTAACQQLELFSADFCIKEVALLTKNPGDCGLIGATFLKNQCYYAVGSANLDRTACALIIESDVLKAQCLQAVDASAPLSCDQETDQIEKEQCYTDAAIAQLNPLVCARVTSIVAGQSQRDNCLNSTLTTFNNVQACDLYIDSVREKNCFFETAKELSDYVLCEKGTEDKIDECIDFIAREKLDAAICQKLSVKADRDACLNYIATSVPTEQSCEDAVNYSAKNECHKALALQTNNAEYCAKISGGQIKNDCFFEVATATNNHELCKKIAPTKYEQKDQCYRAISENLTDETICEGSHFPENYISCFSNIAIITNNIEVCDNREKVGLLNIGYDPKFGCYRDFAIEKSLPTACDLITPTVPKQECIDGTS